MSSGLTTAAYLAAGALFILSLSGLSHPESARRGNLYGMVGMFIAIVATVSMTAVTNYALIAPAMIIGAVVGLVVARRVVMTAMPQLVAMLHSFVGLAAVLVGFATYLDPTVHHSGVERTIHEIESTWGSSSAPSPSPARWSPSASCRGSSPANPCSCRPATG